MIRFLEEHLAETLAIADTITNLELKPGPNNTLIDPGSATKIARFLATRQPVCTIVIHSTNSNAANFLEGALPRGRLEDCVVYHPIDDMAWIQTDWFTAMRRSIVGPIRRANQRKPR